MYDLQVQLEEGKKEHSMLLDELRTQVEGLQSYLFSSQSLKTTEEREQFQRQLTIYQQQIYNLGNSQETTNMTKNGDTYVTGQAGAVGPQSHAHDMNFVQVNNQTDSLDLVQLARELEQLRVALKSEATTPEQDADIGIIARAELEAKNNNKQKAVEFLLQSGKWVLGVAEKIGVALIVGLIKDGLQGA